MNVFELGDRLNVCSPSVLITMADKLWSQPPRAGHKNGVQGSADHEGWRGGGFRLARWERSIGRPRVHCRCHGNKDWGSLTEPDGVSYILWLQQLRKEIQQTKVAVAVENSKTLFYIYLMEITSQENRCLQTLRGWQGSNPNKPTGALIVTNKILKLFYLESWK